MTGENGEAKIILLADILEQKLRKETELAYYEQQLKALQIKMNFLKNEISITNLIIQLVADEKIIDIRDYLGKPDRIQ